MEKYIDLHPRRRRLRQPLDELDVLHRDLHVLLEHLRRIRVCSPRSCQWSSRWSIVISSHMESQTHVADGIRRRVQVHHVPR